MPREHTESDTSSANCQLEPLPLWRFHGPLARAVFESRAPGDAPPTIQPEPTILTLAEETALLVETANGCDHDQRSSVSQGED